MKLSHLKNIIRKTIKEANLLTETHQCNCPQNAINPTTCTNPCAGGCCPGGTDWEGEVALDTSTDPIGTGDFTPDFAKNMPRAINVRPTTLTELKNIIKRQIIKLKEDAPCTKCPPGQLGMQGGIGCGGCYEAPTGPQDNISGGCTCPGGIQPGESCGPGSNEICRESGGNCACREQDKVIDQVGRPMG